MKIAISSSSNDKIDESYKKTARIVVKYLAQEENELIWGSGSISIMGICYDEFSKKKRKIYGFTSQKYVDDIKNLPLAKHTIKDDTFDLKKAMFENADVIIFLPGGTGTISEFFSDLEEVRSNDKNKMLILYNENHIFDKTLELIDDLVNKKFNSSSIYDYFKVVNNVLELKEIIENYEKINK